MPAGVAPAGSEVGELDSSVRLPPLTANTPTLPIRLSSMYKKPPSGLSRASTAPTPPVWPTGVLPSRVSAPSGPIEKREIVPEAVFTVNRNWPSGVISTQHGAIWPSLNGEPATGESVPSVESVNAETVPLLTAVLCALETNSWPGSVGRNSLPNGPRPSALNGDPGAAASRPPEPTVKLSITEVPTSVPASLVPVPLNSTSPGAASAGSETVEPGIGSSRPLGRSRKPTWLLPASTAITNRPPAENCKAPCEASPDPVPAPPATNGDPGTGVSEPSACRSNAPIVLVPAVLSLTYTCPTTGE